MLLCWSNISSERPNFSEIVRTICAFLPTDATANASPPCLRLRSSIYDLPPDFYSQDEDCPPYDFPPDSNNIGSESLLNSIISQLQDCSSVRLLENESNDPPIPEATDDYTEMQHPGKDNLEPLVIENHEAVPGDREHLYVNVLSEYSNQYVDVSRKNSHQYDTTTDQTASSLTDHSCMSLEQNSCPSFSRSRTTSAASRHTTTAAKME